MEPKSICECYNEPVNVISGGFNATSRLNSDIDLNNGYLLEYWVKLWESKSQLIDVLEMKLDDGIFSMKMKIDGIEVKVGVGGTLDMLASGLQGTR
jgi:hypothetical protein